MEISEIGPNGRAGNSDPQANVSIFADQYYSMVWVPGTEPRAVFAERFQPTDSEMVAAYQSIVVNSGTYELTDSTMITRPIVARVPGFVGGSATYNFRLEGDTLRLTLVDEYSRDGIQAPWVVADSRTSFKLVRVE